MRVRLEILLMAAAFVGVATWKGARWSDVEWVAPEMNPASGGDGRLPAGHPTVETPAGGAGAPSAAVADDPSNAPDAPIEEEFPEGNPAPAFALPDEKGNVVRLEDLRGRVFMYNVFATWCEPCVEEIPLLVEVQKRFGAKGFTIVLGSWDDDAASLRKKWNPDGSGLTLVFDKGREVGHLFGTTKVPEAYLIDRRGRIRYKFTHARRWTEPRYLGIIEKLLAEGTAAAPVPPTAPATTPAAAPASGSAARLGAARPSAPAPPPALVP